MVRCYIASALLHAGAIAAAVVWIALFPAPSRPHASVVRTTTSDEDRELTARIQESSARSGEELLGPLVDSSRRNEDASPHLPGEGNVDASVLRQLEAMRDAADARSADENLTELESLARRLQGIADPSSVQDLTSTLSRALGANDRTPSAETRPRNSDREFDVSTSQVS
ncbi:MAG: hypothetical protein KF861_17085, partial [Planctomycetaceae bacterium]|nr:hypothetical protein [Planctomycetaceae bacterium]